MGFPCGSTGKESACLGSIPGLGRSLGDRKGCPLQYSGLENSMDCTVADSRTQLRDFHFHLLLKCYCMPGNEWRALIRIALIHSYRNSIRLFLLLSLFYRWKNWVSEEVRNLSNVTQPLSGRAMTKPRPSDLAIYITAPEIVMLDSTDLFKENASSLLG